MSTKPFKQKEGKIRFDLIPAEMDESFAEVATFGVNKLRSLGISNPDRNWEQGLKLVEDHLAALKRHLNKWEQGIDIDSESTLNHLQHAHWHLSCMVTQIKRKRKDLDDRSFKNNINVPKNKSNFDEVGSLPEDMIDANGKTTWNQYNPDPDMSTVDLGGS